MRQGGIARAPGPQVSAAFSRRLTLSVVAVVFLMAATLTALFWMAREQDRMAEAASRRMVAGGVEGFVASAKSTLLDYAIWTDAYRNILDNDLDWVASNVGASAEASTFDLVLIERPGGGSYGWDAAGGPLPDLLAPDAQAAVNRLLDDVPVDSGTAEAGYFRSDGALWFLAIARVVPQEAVPTGLADADVPRLVIGFRMTDERLADIGRPFAIERLNVAATPAPGASTLPLAAPDGTPLAWISWKAPEPGRAVLRGTLWPLFGLMLAVAVIVLLVSRELLRSARRLEGALIQARAADRTKSEFLSNVSHELRTPLNGVIGIAQLLQLREPDPEAQEMLGLLLASARSQLQLVNGLLDIARIEAGTLTLDAVPFEPAAELGETVQLLRPEAEAKRLTLELTVAPSADRTVIGDALAFRQIATNLISNAVKFTQNGGVSVSLSADDAGTLVLAVTDTGIGIAPAEHARIFERFTQVEGVATRRAGGTGIGLAITQALVELQRGSIRVRSALGQGSTFTVELPLPAADATATAA